MNSRVDGSDPRHHMASPPWLRVERHGALALLGLTRAVKQNALDVPTVLGIEAFFEAPPGEVEAVILHSEGDDFCVGLDLDELSEADSSSGSPHFAPFYRALERMECGRVPVVAILKGAVVGGGLELASAAHIRVAESSAFYSLPESQHGLFVGSGAPARVAKLIGAHRMGDLMLTGRVFDAAEGQALGLSHYLTEPGEGLPRALELAERIVTSRRPP